MMPCSLCHAKGHNASTCPSRPSASTAHASSSKKHPKRTKPSAHPQPTAPDIPKTSNEAFRAVFPRIALTQQKKSAAEQRVTQLEGELEAIRVSLESARAKLTEAEKNHSEAHTELAELRPRRCFHSALPDCVALSILGSLGHRGGGRAAMVCRGFRGTVARARELKMYINKVLSVSAGDTHTVVCTVEGTYIYDYIVNDSITVDITTQLRPQDN